LLGVQLQFDRHGIAQNVEHRTMRVDDFLQFGEVGSGRAAFEIDGAADIVEAGADAFLYREKAAQIERPFELDGDAIKRDAERGGISPIGDFLACSERCQHELDRIRTRVRSAEARRFVDGHGELSDFRFASQFLDLARVGGKGRDRMVGVGTQIGLGRNDNIFKSHSYSLRELEQPDWSSRLIVAMLG
jgi:hypothetical protein